jgi:lipopolysaccharide export system protein LptA
LEAFGHVVIDDQDSVKVFADLLYYDGNSKVARLRENVIFEKREEMTLYTDKLDYDRVIELANYYEGGKIVDSTNELQSLKGYYEVRRNMASFKTDVVGVNPDYTLKTDTLQYNTSTKIIYFRDTTYLTDKDSSVFVYRSGEYDTKIKRSDFLRGYLESESYFLYGDELRVDDISGLNTARGNVRMVSKENNIIILGEKADYYKLEKTVKVYDNALVKMSVGEADTLYLSADTLVSIDADLAADKRIQAFNKVKIFKSDLQGIADSLVYFQKDSLLTFYVDPVIWSEDNQMTADTINLVIANQTLSSLHLVSNSFVIAQDTLGNYNQIKGRTMDAEFFDEELKTVYVNGNGESLFFMLKEDNTGIMGMNKILCSDMTLHFSENEISNVTFYTNPDGQFIPPHELKTADRQLNGFRWYGMSRPRLIDVVPQKYLSGMVDQITAPSDVPSSEKKTDNPEEELPEQEKKGAG